MWGVRWADAETAKARVFISVAADGRMVMWSLVKDKLQHEVHLADVQLCIAPL